MDERDELTEMPQVGHVRETRLASEGELHENEDTRTGATLGGVGGALIGAAAGAAVGPAGSVIGAVIGGLTGAGASGLAVDAVEQIEENRNAHDGDPVSGHEDDADPTRDSSVIV